METPDHHSSSACSWGRRACLLTLPIDFSSEDCFPEVVTQVARNQIIRSDLLVKRRTLKTIFYPTGNQFQHMLKPFQKTFMLKFCHKELVKVLVDGEINTF